MVEKVIGYKKYIDLICNILGKKKEDISNIMPVKSGMTNYSITFECDRKKYIFRIPGEGTGELINRQNEADVYDTIKNIDFSDSIIYFDAATGYKLTQYIDGARVCNSGCQTDVKKCMQKLRTFHQMKLVVNHEFDIFERIQFYENLRQGKKSVYVDYAKTKENVFVLQKYINKTAKEKVLCHIDSVADNFLFTKEKVYMIDWEYAAMQDPHIDIAMFCIYSGFSKDRIDETIDYYFEGTCSKETRTKIYCYIAAAGLLWSNWCEYKEGLGIVFGQYAINQYMYAKQFYQIAIDSID